MPAIDKELRRRIDHWKAGWANWDDAMFPRGETHGLCAALISALEAAAQDNDKLRAYVLEEHTEPPCCPGDDISVELAVKCAELQARLEAAAPVADAVEWLKDHADYAHYSCDGWEVICAGDERGYGATLPAAVAALAKQRGE